MEGENDQQMVMDEIINKLRTVVTLNTDDKDNDIIKILDDFLVTRRKFPEDNYKIDDNNVNVFIPLLKYESNMIPFKTANVISKIARETESRQKFSQREIIKLLVDLLKKDDIEYATVVCRALTNLCYENAEAGKMVQDNGGLELALEILKKSVSMEDHYDEVVVLRNIIMTFLGNVLVCTSTALEQENIEEILIPSICNILELDIAAGRNPIEPLLLLESLSYNNRQFLSESLAKLLVIILDADIPLELLRICIAVFEGQICNDKEARILSAKIGVCDAALKLMEKYVIEDVDGISELVELASSTIDIIIKEEENMDLLYKNGEGAVYKKLLEWLMMETCNIKLQQIGVMGIVEFGNNDTNCHQMVLTGVHKHLFRLLSESKDNDDESLQYNLLSAIKNFVIFTKNKPILLEDGIIDILYPMLNTQKFEITFKLIATMRLVIDGQQRAAIALGMRDGILKRTVELCNLSMTSYQNVNLVAEAYRFLASLVMNGRNKELILFMINHGATPHLVSMIKAKPARMQYEALASLVIITTLVLDECEKLLISSDIAKKLEIFVTISRQSLKLPVFLNALTLMTIIVKSDIVKKHLKSSELLKALNKCEKEAWTESMKKKLETFSNLLNT